MDLIKKIKLTTYRLTKYFKNHKYKKQIKKEKSKKYLFKKDSSKTNKNLFDIYKKQIQFSTFINAAWENFKSFRVYYYLLGIILISMTIYIAAFSPYFRISPSKVIIERMDSITDINMAYKAIEKVYWESIFAIDKESITNDLLSYQKNIRKAEITRLYPNWIKIIIESYKPQFFTQFAWIDKKYIVTSNWVLIYEKNIDKLLTNLEIVDNSLIEAWFFDYKEWVSTEVMKKVIFTRDLFKDIFPNKNIAKLIYFKLENELHISLETWTKIIIELNSEIWKQLAMLKFYNDNNKDIISSWELIYVDSRIFWKIYACIDKVACPKNLNRIYPNYYKK